MISNPELKFVAVVLPIVVLAGFLLFAIIDTVFSISVHWYPKYRERKRRERMRPIHPGEILREEFNVKSGKELAEKCGCTSDFMSFTFQSVLDEKESISDALAEGLSIGLKTTKEFWLNLQNDYDVKVRENGKSNTVVPDPPTSAAKTKRRRRRRRISRY